MNLQPNPFSCGVLSVQNALEALGVTVSYEEVEEAAGTKVWGTDARNVRRAVRRLGFKPITVDKRTPKDAEASLFVLLAVLGCPVILAVDEDEHWVAAIGHLGRERVLVADSADPRVVIAYEYGELLDRWVTGKRRQRFYGIAVETPK